MERRQPETAPLERFRGAIQTALSIVHELQALRAEIRAGTHTVTEEDTLGGLIRRVQAVLQGALEPDAPTPPVADKE